jgi:hypothetical protein
MSPEQGRILLGAVALAQAQVLGHSIPGIVWASDCGVGEGTCVRCGDGLIVYLDRPSPSIQGTAYTTPCPGNICDHGWQLERHDNGAVVMRCLHCGAVRSELGRDDW